MICATNLRLCCLLLLALLLHEQVKGQQNAVSDSISTQQQIRDSVVSRSRFVDSIAFNIHLQVHVSHYQGIYELGENVPRFGTSIYRNVGHKTRVFARLEYGLNLSQGTKFNNNANSNSDFIRDPFQEPEPFTQRLAYLGIAHETLGSIVLGKQWGAYYDIGGFTDAFTVFGSSGVDVYAGGTDGGWKGTGRSDVTVLYRNHFKKLYFSLQTQLFGSHTNYGAAVSFRFNPRLNMGVGWNLANIPDEFTEVVEEANQATHNFILGYQYQDLKWYSALTAAYIQDRYRRIDENNVIALPVYGMEFLNRYTLSPRIKIEAGFNAQWQTGEVNPEYDYFRLLQFYAGMNYHFGDLFSIYLQGRLDDSRFVPGVQSANVIIIGFSFDFIKGIGRS